ncbi:hypothetical protein DH2020_034745 [Rehmannia glutinosa]|uniref:cellulase n=1 Tax=Rehmannia glutinosa TaxID=99300 RepID=A0ABR0V8H0_REHGL
MSETSESEIQSVRLVHSVSGSGRLLPSASHWNSIELDFINLLPQTTSDRFDSLPSRFSKSVDFNLSIGDKSYFKRCVYASIFVVLFVPVLFLLLHFLAHKKQGGGASKDLTLALNQALLFFDAQKSGRLPGTNPIKFRGNSGLNDGKEGNTNADLVGGFYDSGKNIKFSFSTAYTVTLLSWTVVEYKQKYADIGELDHIKDIIKWGSDYLLKLFIPPNSNSDSAILYSQVGGNGTNQENDINCWQRPEDMNYPRPVSICNENAEDLAGEIIAGMSAASLVFSGDKIYSKKLVEAAEKLFGLVTRHDFSHKPGMYTKNDACGGQARGGLVFLKPDAGGPLQYAATASFLSKLYSDYLQLLKRTIGSCSIDVFSVEMLQDFAMSQVHKDRQD